MRLPVQTIELRTPQSQYEITLTDSTRWKTSPWLISLVGVAFSILLFRPFVVDRRRRWFTNFGRFFPALARSSSSTSAQWVLNTCICFKFEVQAHHAIAFNKVDSRNHILISAFWLRIWCKSKSIDYATLLPLAGLVKLQYAETLISGLCCASTPTIQYAEHMKQDSPNENTAYSCLDISTGNTYSVVIIWLVCTGSSSQGRARLRVFRSEIAWKNTQLSPSLTRKPCTYVEKKRTHCENREHAARAHFDFLKFPTDFTGPPFSLNSQTHWLHAPINVSRGGELWSFCVTSDTCVHFIFQCPTWTTERTYLGGRLRELAVEVSQDAGTLNLYCLNLGLPAKYTRDRL